MSCLPSSQLSVDGYNPCAFIHSGRHYESKEDYPKLADVWNARFQAWADNQMNISRAVARDRARRCPGPPRFKRFLCIRKPLRRPSTIKARVASTFHAHPGIYGKHAKSRLFKPYTCNVAVKGPADANVEKAANARILVREHLATRLRKDVRRSSRMKSSAKSQASAQAAALESQVRTITLGFTHPRTRSMDYKITALSFGFSRLSLGDKIAELPLDFSHLSLDDPIDTDALQECVEDGAGSSMSSETRSVADTAPPAQEANSSPPTVMLLGLGDLTTAAAERSDMAAQSLRENGQSDIMDSEVPVLDHKLLLPTTVAVVAYSAEPETVSAAAEQPSNSTPSTSAFFCDLKPVEMAVGTFRDMMMDDMPEGLSNSPWMVLPLSFKPERRRRLPGHYID